MATHKIPHTGQEIDTAIENALKISKSSVTISTSGWVLDSATGCYRKEVAGAGITEQMSVDLILDIPSLTVAGNCGLKPVTESYSGGFYIYADAVPPSQMTGTVLTR